MPSAITTKCFYDRTEEHSFREHLLRPSAPSFIQTNKFLPVKKRS
jgi:hypothetical protein